MEPNIREYRTGDFAEIEKIWKSTGMGGAFRGDDAGVVEDTIRSGGKLFVLEDRSNREIIGTSWLTQDGRRIYLHHFGIKPEYQGRGLSHLLMKASKEFAKSTGLQIKLEVHKSNTVAITLYKKWGFEFLGDYDVYIIRDYNSISLSGTSNSDTDSS